MQRKKSLLAATIISAAMLTGSVAYAATSLLDNRDDNVGKLETVTNQPIDATPSVPTNGSVTSTTAPRPANTPSAVGQPGAVTPRPSDDHGDDDDDIVEVHGGDRRHGRGGDDD